jgi:hypothetical protein
MGVEQVTQAQNVRPPLADELSGEAAFAVGHRPLRSRVVPMHVVLAAPQLALHGLASGLEAPAITLGVLWLVHEAGHLLAGTQGGQVERADEGVGPLDRHIVGVGLRAVDDAVAAVVARHNVV